jgi:hypothetical protein
MLSAARKISKSQKVVGLSILVILGAKLSFSMIATQTELPHFSMIVHADTAKSEVNCDELYLSQVRNLFKRKVGIFKPENQYIFFGSGHVFQQCDAQIKQWVEPYCQTLVSNPQNVRLNGAEEYYCADALKRESEFNSSEHLYKPCKHFANPY